MPAAWALRVHAPGAARGERSDRGRRTRRRSSGSPSVAGRSSLQTTSCSARPTACSRPAPGVGRSCCAGAVTGGTSTAGRGAARRSIAGPRHRVSACAQGRRRAASHARCRGAPCGGGPLRGRRGLSRVRSGDGAPRRGAAAGRGGMEDQGFAWGQTPRREIRGAMKRPHGPAMRLMSPVPTPRSPLRRGAMGVSTRPGRRQRSAPDGAPRVSAAARRWPR